MKLHLGVVDVPYDDGEATTGEVAQILESEYHIMEIFADEMRDAISDAFAESARVALEDLMSGAPFGGLSLTFEATEEIGSAFRIFIDQQELDGVVPGVPTGASLRGVNHRLADPYAATNPPRPSFRDTGHYEDSFRAWTE